MAFSACIGLGANLGNPIAALQSAIAALEQLPGTHLCTLSAFYRSAPVGPAGQPDYVNAVARITTRLPPHTLLGTLQEIENQHGRLREVRWGARTLDLDLLLYDNDEIDTPSLIVPHRELKNRNFVIIPLLEVCPDLTLPDGTVVASLPTAHDYTGLVRLNPLLPFVD
ncbi:MAG: 2-amino-4-hydroxy-6-hydroxymethyldihydropteridine diphosphokinase [Moraxellaceae bacterium]|nr:2-amino-4-hydroxy-6-hydroxymethyldihydropteridine diphosphokinase [Moraxellaceae bacterium]MBP8851504.1 2-amino-4-hydroxy-6-hydroxymethyldihydropteridine diphosphokinase [Moraxellaceae bacterium]MBP9044902.1 2-amino-4-hydroxy-6-hydroxymethyldihydropteridine diphosphokinase [Moraxellaceae bacterium]MBP9730247.1 2-amino-4-hydroxy-6-hydroxymethyldihydropteridine diphosphokinase [Moraxellaceae bacterium]MCC6200440.1 2-amino-4-hydroxy-6-hydroxymethyldihydropteridine diphosphokinase [Moraxellaceae